MLRMMGALLILFPVVALEGAEPQANALPQWIATAKNAAAPGYFRVAVKLPEEVELDFADLFFAAEKQAVVSINGQRVGQANGCERLAHFAVKKHLRGGENVIVAHVTPGEKSHALLLSLHVVDRQGKETWLVSDEAWQASAAEDFGGAKQSAVSLGPVGTAPYGTPTTEVEHYHQWKQALGVTSAVDPRAISVPEGYAIELVRSAAAGESSWISLAFDERGRLVIGREDKGLWRLTLPELPRRALAGDELLRRGKLAAIDNTLLECRGLLFVGKDLYANANNSKGLYRLRDTDGDDTFDDVKLLREMPGDVGHGRNDLTLGPDGKLYLMLGNDVRYPADAARTSPFRNFAQDRLLPCAWNKFLFNSGTPAPGGYVVRTDREAKSWEVVAGGFRNAYGIAFNEDGELFTYDADMEWDAGAPWYRPTRINHIVSGGDYGWRQGTDKWRAWYADSLPSTLDIGLGSPTAVKFVPREFSQFSADYGGCLLALDWAFGRIIAVRLTPQGASYSAKQEPFISGRPLNVCDAEFGPDGALYFVTGGRGTQSGIYRVVCTKETRLDDPKIRDVENDVARHHRQMLEKMHGRQFDGGVKVIWDLWQESDDPWLLHAGRVALEHQQLDEWRDRALREERPANALAALLALARVGPRESQAALWDRLARFDAKALAARLPEVLRIYQLSLLRQGRPSEEQLARLRARCESWYPATSVEANDLLCELLVFLESSKVVERTLPLIDAAATPEEKLHYVMCLRLVKEPWTLAQRQAYFGWLQRAETFPGAHYMPRFVAYIREDAIATLSEEEKRSLGDLLQPAAKAGSASPQLPPRPFVKAWTLDDFARDLDRPAKKADPVRGQELFIAADCAKCHRLAGAGSLVGPDLTGVGKRFSKRDILLSILEPSRVIDDKYKQRTVTTTGGITYVGQVAASDERELSLITDPTQPTKLTRIPRREVESSEPSTLSPMPSGTINTLTHAEVLELLELLSATAN